MTTGSTVNADDVNATSVSRVQPGRIRLTLWDPLLDDHVVGQIAQLVGVVKNFYRPQHNPQWVFVQYEDASVAEQAIAMMKNLPIFKAVDPAIKSERFVKEKSDVGGSNMNNNYNDDQQQRNSSMNNQMNKGSGNRQQRGGNNSNNNKSNKNNNNSMNGGGS
ncbi:AAEL012437-PA, partial [Aedes aegypti]